MKSYTRPISIFLLLIGICSPTLQAQQIKAKSGYDTQIGNMVSMLEDLKSRVTYSVANLSEEETDFLLDEDANRIGAMIYHLAATEKYYQLYTFENRGFNRSEKEWETALGLGENGRKTFVNKPISYYLDIWDEVRKETLRLLKTKNDAWFEAKVEGSSMNNHWAWYHVMEHQANHMGQIRLIIKRIPRK
ncbi:DinB family protein [uncultured Kordia sp.]|uniref:DinB family protein n=1 Tax=uncultured Kordia sp. TaxID=507699 RepID=UPI0026046D93|nr:DinB family protein [uncultured Kordia sp.]